MKLTLHSNILIFFLHLIKTGVFIQNSFHIISKSFWDEFRLKQFHYRVYLYIFWESNRRRHTCTFVACLLMYNIADELTFDVCAYSIELASRIVYKNAMRTLIFQQIRTGLYFCLPNTLIISPSVDLSQ